MRFGAGLTTARFALALIASVLTLPPSANAEPWRTNSEKLVDFALDLAGEWPGTVDDLCDRVDRMLGLTCRTEVPAEPGQGEVGGAYVRKAGVGEGTLLHWVEAIAVTFPDIAFSVECSVFAQDGFEAFVFSDQLPAAFYNWSAAVPGQVADAQRRSIVPEEAVKAQVCDIYLLSLQDGMQRSDLEPVLQARFHKTQPAFYLQTAKPRRTVAFAAQDLRTPLKGEGHFLSLIVTPKGPARSDTIDGIYETTLRITAWAGPNGS